LNRKNLISKIKFFNFPLNDSIALYILKTLDEIFQTMKHIPPKEYLVLYLKKKNEKIPIYLLYTVILFFHRGNLFKNI
ncbi:hypothetical protein M153_13140003, partial [Pseudoloma neurophilia]